MSAGLMLAGSEVEQTQRLKELREWTQSATAAEAADLADKAKKARDVVKALKASLDLAVEATRLEMAALRRIGQLGEVGVLPSTFRTAAEWYGKLWDFDDLLAEVSPGDTAIAIHRRHLRKEREAEDAHRRRNIGRGRPDAPCPPDDAPSRREIQAAAETILESLSLQADSFTTADAVDQLADALGMPDYMIPTRLGFDQIIRDAVGGIGIDYDAGYRCPQFVTYQEAHIGWVRVPWETASVEQFRHMVEYRRHQADLLMKAWKELNLVLEVIEAEQAEFPESDKCADLIARAVPSIHRSGVLKNQRKAS